MERTLEDTPNLDKFSRPTSWEDVVGQDLAVSAIRAALRREIYGPFLLYGIRGIGKTTIARLIAKQVNSTGEQCDSDRLADRGIHPDIIEMDGATNNGVDHMRLLQNKLQYAPMYERRVVIIDECHSITRQAFESLLKITEEPPGDSVFIFCTTCYDKVPDTIKSRCLEYNLQPIPDKVIKEYLRARDSSISERFVSKILERAGGSLRDAISFYKANVDTQDFEDSKVADVLKSVLQGELSALQERYIDPTFLEESFRILLENSRTKTQSGVALESARKAYEYMMLAKGNRQHSNELTHMFLIQLYQLKHGQN